MNQPFIIYANPRSRTAWLSKFLTYEHWTCHHDIVIDLFTLNDIKQKLTQPFTGTAETGMVDGWEVMEELVPNARRVVVTRPVAEIVDSLVKFGIRGYEDTLQRRAEKLKALSAEPGVLTVSFDDLNTEETCRAVFEHCLRMPFDRAWWMALKDANIQIDMSERLNKLRANYGNIARLKAEVEDFVI